MTAPAPITATLRYTGTLTAPPQVRTRVSSPDGHTVPVLCLALASDGPLHAPIHVEQPFPAGEHAQCEAAARRLKPGMHLTVEAPTHAMRLVLADAAHIHLNPAPARETP